MDRQNLIRLLAHWLAQGKLEIPLALPALERLTEGSAPSDSFLALLEAVDQENDVALQPLARSMRAALRAEALRWHQRRRQSWPLPAPDPGILSGLAVDLPTGWILETDLTPALDPVHRLIRDAGCLAAAHAQAPLLLRELRRQFAQEVTNAGTALAPTIARLPDPLWQRLATAWRAEVPVGNTSLAPWFAERANGRARAEAWRSALSDSSAGTTSSSLDDASLLAEAATRFVAATPRPAKEQVLDALCSWPNPAGLKVARSLAGERWARDRVLLNFTVRFGQASLESWEDWGNWLAGQEHLWEAEQRVFEAELNTKEFIVLLILSGQVSSDDSAALVLWEKAVRSVEAADLGDLINRWSRAIAPDERAALLQGAPAMPHLAPPIIGSESTPVPARVPPVPAARPLDASAAAPVLARSTSQALPPALPKPSVWDEHIQPFFAENWYVVAGIAMVILGSSLLAYYTWDKHWLVRYTIMPALLAAFTWSLAGVGSWIEKKDRQFRGTAAILRGAAIGLLPINFMTMALLSADQQVPQKGAVLLAMAFIYLSVFGWGLRRWCTALEPAVGNLLAGTLLFLNALVAVAPLAQTVGGLQGGPLLRCIGAGFYLGFVVAALAVVHFTRRTLTREMALERRVPWFVGSVLTLTFGQVFVWVHGFVRHLPEGSTYALLVIATGWLILHSERRALELVGNPQTHSAESFLGYAFVLAGLLMGFAAPYMRVASLAAAGTAWFYQAMGRRHPLHDWIALTFWGLAVAAVGFLPGYPGVWLPLLGLLAACAYGAGSWAAHRRGDSALAAAARGMQVVALIGTTLAAPLAQWHYGSAPLPTAGWLVLVAALLGWRSWQDQKSQWLHATMLVLALALPYAGFVDMAHRTAHHNTLAFGLSILSAGWLALTRLKPDPFFLQARSTVLFYYGAFSLAALLLRLSLGDAAPTAFWYRDYMDYLGPILATVVLIPATYHSRSLVPAVFAVSIMAILFPELRANLRQSIPGMSWGSGLGSAIWGLGLIWLCFFLRRSPRLQSLPGGDPLTAREGFPFRRHDSTLFTWPILAAAMFLLIKVDVWSPFQNQVPNGIALKTSLAIGLTGIAWTFLAIYGREEKGAVLGVHLGWICALVGMIFGYGQAAAAPNWSWPLLGMGLLLQGLYLLYRFVLEPRHAWVNRLLTAPTRSVLAVGSASLAAACIVGLVLGLPFGRIQSLYCFLAAELAWDSLSRGRLLFGTILFVQCWVGLLSLTAPGDGELWERIALDRSLSPTLWLFLGTQLVAVALERQAAVRARMAPLLQPAIWIATGATALLGITGFVDGMHWLSLTPGQQSWLLALVLLTARNQLSGPFLLLSMGLGYVFLHRGMLAGLTDPGQQLEVLMFPWRVSLLGVSMVLLLGAGRWFDQRRPGWLIAPNARSGLMSSSPAWVAGPALLVGVIACLWHTLEPAWRESPTQLWAPYLAALTFGLVAWFERRSRLTLGAALLLVLGNTHLVRVFAGDFLRARGLSELHLICLGIGLSLLQASALKRGLRPGRPLTVVNLGQLTMAGAVLILLAANYFAEPSLLGITSTRFAVAGLLALVAGLYFRHAARHAQAGEEERAELAEAFYHFGVVLALWCAALIVPWLRQPGFALMALGFPAVYFFGRAEWGTRRELVEARRYRNSAAVLSFMLLGLYTSKGLFHLVLFPGTAITTEYYHHNAPVILLLGLLMFRLHGLGGTSWLSLYGGLALMTASYFLVTGWPGFSPFDHPIPAAWCVLGLGHFWTLLSYERSPVRTQIQRLAKLDDSAWHSLRRSWGVCLLVATQLGTLWGVLNYAENTFMIAPLLAGAASSFIHQGVLRRSPAYLLAALLELALALHMDFLIPSYLPKEQVIWVILAAWVALLTLSGRLQLQPSVGGVASFGLALGLLAHACYHQPWAPVSLWAISLGSVLAACTPQGRRQPSNPAERALAAWLLGAPVWLTYFSQVRFELIGPTAAFEPWPILAATACSFALALFARAFPSHLAARYHAWPRRQWRVFDTTATWLASSGDGIYRVLLWGVSAVTLATQITHYHGPFAVREIALLAMIEAALVLAWFYRGKAEQSALAYSFTQAFAIAIFAAIRRQVMLTTHAWNYEYDVWASLVFSSALIGARQLTALQPRAAQRSLLTAVCLIPILALAWVWGHGLGVNMALLVVGLHSVLFAYLGKDERESPYNLVALAGFVAFILMTFYSKFHLRMLHAYVIPVGLGVLVLQELFRGRIQPAARNTIRLVTLLTMLSSAGYYALTDTRYPIALNLTMIVLCLLLMAFGTALQLRLYLGLGLAGLLTDLASLLYKVLLHMDRSARMTVIGVVVLSIGALLVFGAIYYKTNKATIDAFFGRWRTKFAGWD